MPAGTRTRIWPWRALAFLFLLSLPRASLALEVTRGPSLQVLTGTSATVEWDTDVSAGCSLEIGPVGGVTTTIAGSTATHCEFPLQNLTSQTTYQYVAKGNGITLAAAQFSTLPHIRTVFIILMENHGWSEVKSAPYIAQLAETGAHAENYKTSIHPSEPNYIILEAGTNCPPLADGSEGHCFTSNDNPTGSNHTASPFHLVRYLEDAGISWKAYQEGISGSDCPLTRGGGYAPKHVGMIFFDDVTGASDPSDPDCIRHFRPYDELAPDLAANRVARYNFITPNLCHDMHDCSVAKGDTWLSEEVPRILGSAAYRNGGLLILTWDEDHGSPIGLILNSPAVKPGYSNSIAYSHPSTVRTLQEIFGVVPPRFPWLGKAATATDLSDLLTGSSVSVTTTTSTTTTTRAQASTTTTTTISPVAGCVPPDCDDGNPCTVDRCEEGSRCAHDNASGLESVRCVFRGAGLQTSMCAGEPLPAAITARFDRAHKLVDRAATKPRPRQAKPLLRRAMQTLKRTSLIAARLGRRNELDPDCVTDLRGVLDDAWSRARLLLREL
jgi:hypothetical protein